jgi:hypothetical protein
MVCFTAAEFYAFTAPLATSTACTAAARAAFNSASNRSEYLSVSISVCTRSSRAKRTSLGLQPGHGWRLAFETQRAIFKRIHQTPRLHGLGGLHVRQER